MIPTMIQAEIRPNQPPATLLDDEGDQYLKIELLGHMPVPSSIETPDQIQLGSLRDGRLKVHSPIIVKFSGEVEHVIAEAAEFNEFGFGKNTSDALIDLQRAIAELYFTLDDEQDHLGKDLQNVWSIIQEKVHKQR